MRSAVVRERSGPFQVEELRNPEPKAGEVLVRVAACGVCHTDLHVHDGSVPFPLPCVLGHEISGTILKLGEGVTDLEVGQRVVGAFIMPCGTCAMCRGGREELCDLFFAHNRLNGTLYDGETRLFDAAGDPVWMYSMGGLSEQAVIPARGVAALHDDLELTDSAILGCALMTAYGAMTHVAHLQREETVAVFGAGGIGGSVIQVARALGASQVIAIDISDDKLDLARDLGATEVINVSRDDPVEAVRYLTAGKGADVALEAIGRPQTFRQATETIVDGGRAVMVGIAPVGLTAEVEITRLVRRKIQILGSFGGRPRHDLQALMNLVVRGELKLAAAIGARFSLEQSTEAYTRLAAGEIRGRALIEM